MHTLTATDNSNMNSKVIFVMLGFAALAAADSFESYEYVPRRFSSEEDSASYESGEAKYNFNCAVNDESSENHYGHQEARDGDDTQGSYYVQLPDGRLQTVKYFVDGDSGYVAEVNYEGSASFESGSFESGSAESYERPRYYYDSNESKQIN